MKQLAVLFIFLTSSLVPFSITSPQPPIQTKDKEINADTVLEKLASVFGRSEFSPSFSQNGSIMLDYIDFSFKLQFSPENAYAGMRLFYNGVKRLELLTSRSFLQFFTPVVSSISSYIKETQKTTFDSSMTLKKNMERVLYGRLVDEYESFCVQPDTVLSHISEDLSNIIEKSSTKKHSVQQEWIEKLRLKTIAFIDSCLQKTIWDAQRPEIFWGQVEEIAYNIRQCAVLGLCVHMDELDDLYWSLTHRLCYFFELFGDKLPINFYEDAQTYLESGSLSFLDFEEEDKGLMSKKELLYQSLANAKMKVSFRLTPPVLSPIEGDGKKQHSMRRSRR